MPRLFTFPREAIVQLIEEQWRICKGCYSTTYLFFYSIGHSMTGVGPKAVSLSTPIEAQRGYTIRKRRILIRKE